MAGEGQLARQIRAGLEDGQSAMNTRPMPAQSARPPIRLVEKKTQGTNFLDQLFFGRPKREHVKEFGALFGTIFCIVGAFLASSGSAEGMRIALWLLGATLVLVPLSYRVPVVVYPLWRGWMAFAHVLGIVMSFVFVTVTWWIMAVPLGLLLKVVGKKVMDLSFDRAVPSYWEERDERYHDFKLLERQF